MIIDVHTHIFPSLPGKPLASYPQQAIDATYKAKRATLGDEGFERWRNEFNGSVEGLIKDMDEAGVDRSVAMSLDLGVMCHQDPEISVWEANEYTAEAQAKYPGRIIGFVSVDPRRRDAIELVERGIKEWGLKGVKLLTTQYYLTDTEVQRFMSKVDDLGVPLMIHSGSDGLPGLPEHSNPKDLAALLLRYPNMTIIAAHCARGYEDLLIEMLFYNQGRLYADTSARQYELWTSPWHFRMSLRYFMDRVPKTILMGSDWPFIKTPPLPTHKEWFDAFRNLEIPEAGLGLGMSDFSQKERDMILGENARALPIIMAPAA